MAFSHGKSASFQVGTVGVPGTPTDISAYLKSVSFPRPVDTAETSTMGTTAKTYVVGMTDATISIEGRYDPTVDTHLAGILGSTTAVTFYYGPAGTTGGYPKYSGSCFLTSYEVATDIGDVASFSAEFQVSGTITKGTW